MSAVTEIIARLLVISEEAEHILAALDGADADLDSAGHYAEQAGRVSPQPCGEAASALAAEAKRDIASARGALSDLRATAAGYAGTL